MEPWANGLGIAYLDGVIMSYRQLNDGERTILAVKAAEGKRLMYKDPVAEREYIKTREQKESGEQLEPF